MTTWVQTHGNRKDRFPVPRGRSLGRLWSDIFFFWRGEGSLMIITAAAAAAAGTGGGEKMMDGMQKRRLDVQKM